MSRPVIEPGNTVQFTFVASVAPDSAPTFKVRDVGDTVVASITAVQSDSTHYYALYTVPDSDQPMVGEWYALKTFSGSARVFIKKYPFNVAKTRAS